MPGEIWVLGATGRTGCAIAARLHDAGVPLVLAGRNHDRLSAVAAELGADGPGGKARIVAGSLEAVLAELAKAAPAAVVNTIGPFPATAPQVIRGCPPGTHYVDLANELRAVQLDLGREAADTGRTLVPGAGFGVLATEAALLRVCEGRPAPARVRVDAIASVATEEGVIGASLAGSIVHVIAGGGRRVRNGRLVRAAIAAEPERLTTPDGDEITTVSAPSGELIAAWTASGAPDVVAASGLLPAGAAVRAILPVASAAFALPGVAGLAARRLARMPTKAAPRPRKSSWARARAEWPSGEVREGWLRAGEGMDFTVAASAQTALRLARGEGRPGAFTPGVLFGPFLAEAAGAEFVTPAPATN
jgi:short subunit dehydrogenase-like uncharacterized protein